MAIAAMKRRDLVKHLSEHGCALHHSGKKHDIWINRKTEARAPVPRHKELPKLGTIRGICKQLGVPSPV